MDNITHSLAGWVLGQAGLKAQSRKGLAALILGANMPDVDVFFGAVPWEPLATHRGFTHGLVGGVLLMPPLLAGLLWLVRPLASPARHGIPQRPADARRLAGRACYLGALSHPLLRLADDLFGQLLSPSRPPGSTPTRCSSSTFGYGCCSPSPSAGRGGARSAGRSGGARPKPPSASRWPTSLSTWRSPSKRSAQRATGPANAAPRPSSPRRRRSGSGNAASLATGHCYRHGRFEPFGGGLQKVSGCTPANLDDPLVREAVRRDPLLRKFLRWSILPLATVERGRCAARVTIGDARYLDRRARSRLSRQAIVPTGAPGCQVLERSQ